MRRAFATALFCLFPLLSPAQGVTDYFRKISLLQADSIKVRVDALVSSADADSLRADIAALAFDYFSHSPVMGHDAVAVYVADRYFLSKQLEWIDPATYPALYAYAEFNRSSLIGSETPPFIAETIDAHTLSLRDDAGQYKLLYFYDPQCGTCHRYSRELSDLCRNYAGGRLTVYAVNTGSDREEWCRYVADNFSDLTKWKVDFYNLWDPQDDNDYHRRFGVLTTPSMLLVDSQNRIVGRRLDPESLRTLLGVENGNSRSYKKLFRQLFNALQPVDTSDIAQVASSLAVRAAGDSAIWRDTFYELFNYLRDNNDYNYQLGAAEVARNYIVGHPQYWSEEYLDKVRHALDMFALNPLGAKAADLLLQDPSGRSRYMLKGNSKYTLLIFHIVDCPDCRREFEVLSKEAANLRRKGVRTVCIYAGKDESLWRNFIQKHDPGWTFLSDLRRTSGMREKYDVSFVPKMYLLDRNKRVIAKEISADTLIRSL